MLRKFITHNYSFEIVNTALVDVNTVFTVFYTSNDQSFIRHLRHNTYNYIPFKLLVVAISFWNDIFYCSSNKEFMNEVICNHIMSKLKLKKDSRSLEFWINNMLHLIKLKKHCLYTYMNCFLFFKYWILLKLLCQTILLFYYVWFLFH